MRNLRATIPTLLIGLLFAGCQYGTFEVEIQSDDLIVTHSDFLFECDLDVIVDVSQSDFVIDIGELYNGDPAKCSCMYENTTTITDLEPGIYLVNVWLDNFDELMYTKIFIIWDVMEQHPVSGPEIQYTSETSGCID